MDFGGEAMWTACHILNRVPTKVTNKSPYELWCKKNPNLSYLRVWGCRAIVRSPDNKRTMLGKRGLESIFVGYTTFSKTYRLYIIEPNDFIPVHTIKESRDAIFYEGRFSSITRPKDLHQSNPKAIDLNNQSSPQDDHVIIEDEEENFPTLRRSKNAKKRKIFWT